MPHSKAFAECFIAIYFIIIFLIRVRQGKYSKFFYDNRLNFSRRLERSGVGVRDRMISRFSTHYLCGDTVRARPAKHDWSQCMPYERNENLGGAPVRVAFGATAKECCKRFTSAERIPARQRTF